MKLLDRKEIINMKSTEVKNYLIKITEENVDKKYIEMVKRAIGIIEAEEADLYSPLIDTEVLEIKEDVKVLEDSLKKEYQDKILEEFYLDLKNYNVKSLNNFLTYSNIKKYFIEILEKENKQKEIIRILKDPNTKEGLIRIELIKENDIIKDVLVIDIRDLIIID